MIVKRLKFRIGVAGVMLAATLVPASIAGAAALTAPGPSNGQDQVAIKSARLCERPALRTPTPGASLETHDPKDEWLANDAAQAAVRRLNDMVAGRADILGVVADDNAQRVIVVREPGQPVTPQLTADLRAVVKDDLKVVVQPGCRTRGESAGVAAGLSRKEWLPKGSKANFTYGWDAIEGRYVVTIPPGAANEEASLRAQFGESVGVRHQVIQTTAGDRLNDSNAHWGGARLQVPEGECTAGFTAVGNNGKHYMITAGHCTDADGIRDGMIEGNGDQIRSGSRFYGVSSDQRAPSPDAVLVGHQIPFASQTYDRKIHVDPCCPSVRDVVGTHNAGVNEYVCISGSFTRAVCGLRVEHFDLPSSTEYGDGPLTFARRPGVIVNQGGDSGGPIYQRTGTSGALAAGISTAGDRAGADYVYYTRVGTIINGFWQLGLQIKTTGGPA